MLKTHALPGVYGQLEYFENNLHFLKQALAEQLKGQAKPAGTLFGSLPAVDVPLEEFQELRQELSSSWQHSWITRS